MGDVSIFEKIVMNTKEIPTKAFVLAGGKGTRSENPKIPKILQEIGSNLSLLDVLFETLLRSRMRDTVFLLGTHERLVIDALEHKQQEFPEIKISYCIDEPGSEGTSAALINAIRKKGSAERNLLILGDTAISAPLNLYIDQWIESATPLGLAIHPNLHPYDSDCMVFENQSLVGKFKPKNGLGGKELMLSWPVTGLALFSKDVADNFSPHTGDATRDLVLTSENLGHGVFGLKTSHYFADSGTKQRLGVIRGDQASGHINRKGANERPAVFLDRDGTIIPDQGSARINLGSDELSKPIAEGIGRLNSFGVPVFLVTNQPGIAKGQISWSQVDFVHARLQHELSNFGAYLDDIIYCPHHPEAGFAGERVELKIICECRKPGGQMLQTLSKRHNLSLADSWLIGDSIADEKSAFSCNVSFLLASCDEKVGMATAAALELALDRIRSKNDNF